MKPPPPPYEIRQARPAETLSTAETEAMKELNHNTQRYAGRPGEQVNIRVEAQGTSHLVEYTLDGETRPLKKGTPITFRLGNTSGARTDLQIVLDFDGEGSYEVVIENVTGCSKDTAHQNRCADTWDGPPLTGGTYAFFVD
jgi:uncharacterized lipoprotein NlpE involved in copper resistance